MPSEWTFQTEKGVFVELSELQADYPGGKVTTQPRLGLVPGQPYPSDNASAPDQRDWVRFAEYVRHLNRTSPTGVAYKLLYLTRHGLGYHNKKHAEVGTTEWERKWSLMDGDDIETWFDAHLTDEGKQQAEELCAFWRHLAEVEGAPLPSKSYTSPLARCLETSQIVFGPLLESPCAGMHFGPTVKEALRERMTLHTCDFRRPRSWIKENYPTYVIEDGFSEEDPFRETYGRAGRPETDEEHVARKHKALEDIWNNDEAGVCVSLTVHSYAIRAIQEACGGSSFRTKEGTSLALLVRGERRDSEHGQKL